MAELPSFVLAALALAGSPGPNTLSLAAVGAAFGRLRGMRYMIGLTLGMVFVIAIVGSGVSGILLALPGAAPVITLVAAAYFVYLAYRIATAPPLNEDAGARAAPQWFEGTFLSLVNPKAYAAMAAMYSSFVLVAGDRISDGLTKAGVLLAVLVVVNVAWLFVGAALTRVMRDARWSRVINMLFAVALIVSVVAAVLV
jgi:threonine/homoserine/homoserine lactone efflux protein